jgi:amino acid adenylation domain-containing protein
VTGALSRGQEQLWFHDRLMPAGSYNLPVALDLFGSLDTGALRTALAAVVARHEVLRTSYGETGGVPRAVVHAAVPVELPVRDLTALPATEREAEVSAALAAECAVPVELLGPLRLRARLYRLTAEHHVFLVVLHHIVSDGETARLLVEDLGAQYHAAVTGVRTPRAPAPQFAEHVARQHTAAHLARLDRQRAFWREQLAGLTEIELPTDRPRPPEPTCRGRLLRRELPDGLAAAVGTVARKEHVSPFMVLLSAFAVVLHRYTGRDDLPIGVPGAGRTTPESANTAGLFVNMLVTRHRVHGDEPFRELLLRTRRVVMEAVQHQDLPFGDVVEMLRPERDRRTNPLFQVAVSMERRDASAQFAPSLTMRPRDVHNGLSKFDLDLMFVMGDGGFAVHAEYSEELFDRWRIEQFLDHLVRVVEQAAADPGQPVRDLQLIDERERAGIVEVLTGDRLPLGAVTLPGLVAASTRARPDALAVVAADGRLTYAELDRAANAVADALRGAGTRSGDRVAVRLPPGRALVVAVLGVLTAGAAYVPIAPDTPRARVRYQVAATGAAAAITEAECDVADLAPAAVLRLHPSGEIVAPAPVRSARPSPPAPHDLAYVLHTSGSTGTPKGVLVEHRSAAAFAVVFARRFGIGPDSRVLQFSSLTFDVSVLEIFGTLGAGGTICLPAPGITRSPDALGAYLDEHRITVAALPPTVAALLPEGSGSALRLLSIGGEPFPVELAARWCGPGRTVLNSYGPTETTVIVTAHVCTPGETAPVPIGRLLPNHHAYVVDGAGGIAPVGVPGELWIGGTGVARGYDDHDETARRFVPDPFTPGRGTLYRTGDRCVLGPAGELVFLDRLDDQVKVRGFRVELGEVETVLGGHPDVLRAAATVAGEGDARRVVAFAVPRRPDVPIADPAVWLAARLPPHLVPATVTPIDRIPLTASGKIDRAALPSPPTRLDGARTAPVGPVERELAAAFTAVLGVDGVGALDGFFALGGTSLQVARLVAEIDRRLGVRLDIGAAFAAGTVRALAGLVESSCDADLGPEHLHLLRPAPGGVPLFLIHPSAGSALCYGPLATALADGVQVWGVSAEALHGGKVPDTVGDLAAGYADLLVDTGPDRAPVVGGWSFGGVVAHEVVRLLRARGHAVSGLVLIDAVPPDGSPPPAGDPLARYTTEVERTLGSTAALRDVPADELARRVDTHDRLVRMVHEHLPSPVDVRTVRIEVAGAPPHRWAGLLTGEVEVHNLHTDHFGMISGPAVADVATAIERFVLPQQENRNVR